MLTLSIYISQFIDLSNFPEKPKFGSIHTQNIYKIIIKNLGYFWGITGMDYFGWLWVVALCSWLVGASAMKGLGRKVLNGVERVSPIILEMGLWEIFVCV